MARLRFCTFRQTTKQYQIYLDKQLTTTQSEQRRWLQTCLVTNATARYTPLYSVLNHEYEELPPQPCDGHPNSHCKKPQQSKSCEDKDPQRKCNTLQQFVIQCGFNIWFDALYLHNITFSTFFSKIARTS